MLPLHITLFATSSPEGIPRCHVSNTDIPPALHALLSTAQTGIDQGRAARTQSTSILIISAQ
jgi:hypothetical protein